MTFFSPVIKQNTPTNVCLTRTKQFSSELVCGDSCVKIFVHTFFVFCKSRIFRMHVIFVYFVRGSFRTKVKCTRKVHSQEEHLHRSATVQKFHAYERLESPGYENWVRTKYSGFTVYCNFTNFQCSLNFGNSGGQHFLQNIKRQRKGKSSRHVQQEIMSVFADTEI